MKVKFYQITYKRKGTVGPWRLLEETWYTEKEANRELRQLKMCNTSFMFRKKAVLEADTVLVSAR